VDHPHQEIKELTGDEELIFYEGSKPIRARKIWFFKDKMFSGAGGCGACAGA
jgi:type IV secretion system protein VirD4